MMVARHLARFLTAIVLMGSVVIADDKIDESSVTDTPFDFYSIFGFLIAGPPVVEPYFEKETGDSMTDKGVSACVVCSAPSQIKREFDNIDYELAQYTTFQLHARKIKVIPPDLVKAWLEEHQKWNKPEEIGAAFKTTYVIHIDLDEFSLYEEDSANLYRGRAEAIVSVWKIDGDGAQAEKIFTAEKMSKYPMYQPISFSEKTYPTFKVEYLKRLSDQIGRFFYEYNTADEIASHEE